MYNQHIEIMKNLSQYVTRIMRQKGLSQADVMQRSGRKIAQGYISDIITGKVTNLSMDKFKALAEGLDVNVMELFAAACGVDSQKDYRSEWLVFIDLMEKVVTEPGLMEIIQASMRLKPGERLTVISSIETLIRVRDNQKQSQKQESRRQG
jgi:transcriptional regulator with XRE-family HTH domain